MGVLNVTPDSFSDGGSFIDRAIAIERGLKMRAEGADIVDIGGESTRPATFQDNSPLSEDAEISRILPVIRGLCDTQPGIIISVDTYKSRVAVAALNAGAKIVNDITGLTYDPDMANVVAGSGAGYILMHILGSPRNIPNNPVYSDVIADIAAYFRRQVDYAEAHGVAAENIVLDPGLGFGKTAEHNFEILRRFREFTALGFPLLSGPSRKSFIGKALGGAPPSERMEGTAAAVALSIAGGADIVRVHDVKQMVRVAKLADAIVRGSLQA